MKFIPGIFCFLFIANTASAQSDCKVTDANLSGTYTGECKNGLANGKGEARGVHRYNGTFKAGVPDGTGTYYYNDNMYYIGAFQDGVKEGKGEMHYIRNGSDSTVKGYWSGNEFRGKDYATYSVTGEKKFDRFEIRPSKETGNIVTFELTTTSGSPNGRPNVIEEGAAENVLLLKELYSTNGVEVRKISEFNSGLKSPTKFEIEKFPVKFTCHLSIGDPVYIELYRPAKWTIRIFLNK